MSNELTIEGAIEAVAQGSPTRRAILEAMEAREPWVLDRPGETVDRLLSELGEMIEQGTFVVSEDLRPEVMTDLLSMIRSGRFYRLLREIGHRRREFIDELAVRIQDEENAGEPLSPEINVIRLRLLVADQVGYLMELFAADRMEALSLALEDTYADEY